MYTLKAKEVTNFNINIKFAICIGVWVTCQNDNPLPFYVCDVMAKDSGKCICKITTRSSSLIVRTPYKQNVLPVISM